MTWNGLVEQGDCILPPNMAQEAYTNSLSPRQWPVRHERGFLTEHGARRQPTEDTAPRQWPVRLAPRTTVSARQHVAKRQPGHAHDVARTPHFALAIDQVCQRVQCS